MYWRGFPKSVEKEPYKKAFFQQELFNNVWIFFFEPFTFRTSDKSMYSLISFLLLPPCVNL
jgi:hypothetical protein